MKNKKKTYSAFENKNIKLFKFTFTLFDVMCVNCLLVFLIEKKKKQNTFLCEK